MRVWVLSALCMWPAIGSGQQTTPAPNALSDQQIADGNNYVKGFANLTAPIAYLGALADRCDLRNDDWLKSVMAQVTEYEGEMLSMRLAQDGPLPSMPAVATPFADAVTDDYLNQMKPALNTQTPSCDVFNDPTVLKMLDDIQAGKALQP